MARSLYGLIGVLVLFGCGHAPPPRWNAASHELCQGGRCYRVGALSPAWQEVHKEGGSVGFYNPGLSAVVEANATCRDDAEAAPLGALTRQLLIGYTERQQRTQETFALAGREALRTRVDAKLDGVPVTLDLIVVRRNGCIYDLSYVAPPDRFERGRPEFERFVSGFADQRRPS